MNTATLASGLKLALVYKQISQVGLQYNPGQFYQLCSDVFRHVGHSLQHPRFEIKLENLYGNHMKFRKKWENTIIVNRKYLILFTCL